MFRVRSFSTPIYHYWRILISVLLLQCVLLAQAATAPEKTYRILTPGRTAINLPWHPGMRLKDALSAAHVQSDIGTIRINHRVDSTRGFQTRASVSGLELIHGAHAANLELIADDEIVVQPRGSVRVRLIISQNGPALYGAPISWENLNHRLKSKSDDERWDTQFEIAADSDAITPDQINSVMMHAKQLEKALNLAGTKYIGITLNAIHRSFGIYYIGGHVKQPGIYQLRPGVGVTIKQAIEMAGGLDPNTSGYVQVIRKNLGKESVLISNCNTDPAGEDDRLNTQLESDDQLIVLDHPSVENATIN